MKKTRSPVAAKASGWVLMAVRAAMGEERSLGGKRRRETGGEVAGREETGGRWAGGGDGRPRRRAGVVDGEEGGRGSSGRGRERRERAGEIERGSGQMGGGHFLGRREEIRRERSWQREEEKAGRGGGLASSTEKRKKRADGRRSALGEEGEREAEKGREWVGGRRRGRERWPAREGGWTKKREGEARAGERASGREISNQGAGAGHGRWRRRDIPVCDGTGASDSSRFRGVTGAEGRSLRGILAKFPPMERVAAMELKY